MSTSTISRLLLASFITMALACAPQPAFGQHHGRGGSHGGSRSHSSGYRGGGRSHGSGGFRSGSGHFGGKSFGRRLSAAPQHGSSGSNRGFGGLGTQPKSYAAYFGGRSFRSNQPPTNSSASRGWSSQGQSSWAGTPSSLSSFNSNRPPTVASASRGWSGRGQFSWASTPRSTSSFNPNRPPTAASASGAWSGQGQSSWASLSRSTLAFNPNHRLSNSGNSRFGNSAFGHSSFSDSRTGSNASLFGSSRFAGAHHFDLRESSFGRESWFGGGDFSFIPDLFGLALNLGGFGLRGLGLLGSSVSNFVVPGLGMLGSGSASFSLDAGLESRQWEPGPAFHSTPNLGCPQH